VVIAYGVNSAQNALMNCTPRLYSTPDLTRTDRSTQPPSSRTTRGTPTRRLRTKRRTRVATACDGDGRHRQHGISLSDIPAELSEERTCTIEQPTSIELLTPVRCAVRWKSWIRTVPESSAGSPYHVRGHPAPEIHTLVGSPTCWTHSPSICQLTCCFSMLSASTIISPLMWTFSLLA
jgi:hypothetical protein